MKIDILTLFPEIFSFLENYSIVGRAIEQGSISINPINIRDFSTDKHNRVDDYPYGGGKGMVMKPEPVYEAINSCRRDDSTVVYLSPQGKVLTQDMANELAKKSHIILVSGHYEGLDNRIIENFIDEEISIGDYVLTGGELPAMVLIDTISRLLPNVLKSEESYEIESHYNGLLEYPQYTRPRVFKGLKVPDVLLSGDHDKILKWRQLNSLKVTLKKRTDLLANRKNMDDEFDLLDFLIKKIGKR